MSHLAPIVDANDWIVRSAAAKTVLQEKHGYRADAFIVVDEALRRSGISMNWCSIYPASWARRSKWAVRWLQESCFPIGLTLHWPMGTDSVGEAHDPEDPILLLSEVEFWNSLTPADVARIFEAGA